MQILMFVLDINALYLTQIINANYNIVIKH